jgi:two-component system heavy metal sensor histidine kinase CusS
MSTSTTVPPGTTTRPKEARSFVAEAAAMLAHDLNNQLALLMANFEYLEEFARDRADLPADLHDTVSTSQACLQHMLTLVRNVSDISRMEDPGIHPAPVATDVARLINSVVREHRPLHDRGVVQWSVECPQILRADTDPMLLRRMAHNLVANARRFVDKNGTVRVTLKMENDGAAQTLVLTVANTGQAISPERHETLFNKYRVTPDGRLERGLGLYFCRLAAQAQGGSIALSQEEPFSTVFTIRLSCGPRAAEPPRKS